MKVVLKHATMIEPLIVPEHLHDAIQAAEKPLLFLDHPMSGKRYVMLPLEEYVAICMETIPSGFTRDEQVQMLVELGRRAGWNNSEMDIYNDSEPDRA